MEFVYCLNKLICTIFKSNYLFWNRKNPFSCGVISLKSVKLVRSFLSKESFFSSCLKNVYTKTVKNLCLNQYILYYCVLSCMSLSIIRKLPLKQLISFIEEISASLSYSVPFNIGLTLARIVYRNYFLISWQLNRDTNHLH